MTMKMKIIRINAIIICYYYYYYLLLLLLSSSSLSLCVNVTYITEEGPASLNQITMGAGTIIIKFRTFQKCVIKS